MSPVSHELRSIWVGFAAQTKTNLQSRRGAKQIKMLNICSLCYIQYTKEWELLFSMYTTRVFWATVSILGSYRLSKSFYPDGNIKMLQVFGPNFYDEGEKVIRHFRCKVFDCLCLRSYLCEYSWREAVFQATWRNYICANEGTWEGKERYLLCI